MYKQKEEREKILIVNTHYKCIYCKESSSRKQNYILVGKNFGNLFIRR